MLPTTDRIDLLDRMTKKAMNNMKIVHAAVTTVICFAPDKETVKQLEEGLSLIKKAMQTTASYHANKCRKLKRELK